ncbi:MAG TPA: biotin-dependent carboxyltransferase family protein [Pyrinomonadaceae bacterium]|nr:biotin-dependent carboxyltransferase family protein [Pyrinomonadaceae bacterium]
MTLSIRKPGILTTIQDLGRTGARSLGINPGGAMDPAAVRVLNIALGNDETAPVLEMHFPAAEIEFQQDTVFAIGGADFGAELDGRACRDRTVTFASAGSVLKFTKRNFGQRTYLAVAGGFACEEWLGSSSTNLAARVGGLFGRALQAGDLVECAERMKSECYAVGPSFVSRYSRMPIIRVIAGPEFEFLTSTGEMALFAEEFALSNDCDRMGYRLSGPPLQILHEREMVSAGVNFGTIQLLPDGQMIILMADHQTSGGYPRVGNVISVDLPALAQCGPGDRIRFRLVTIDQAERLAEQFERELKFLRVGCKLQTQNAKR